MCPPEIYKKNFKEVINGVAHQKTPTLRSVVSGTQLINKEHLQTHRGRQEQYEPYSTCEQFLHDLCMSSCVRRHAVIYMRCFRDVLNSLQNKKSADGMYSSTFFGRLPRGGGGRIEIPSRSNFLHFHAVFGQKSCKVIGFAPNLMVVPPIWEIVNLPPITAE